MFLDSRFRGNDEENRSDVTAMSDFVSSVPDDSPGLPSIFKIPDEIDWTAWHELRVELDHHQLRFRLNGTGLSIKTCLVNGLLGAGMRVEHLGIGISSFTLTEGFEEPADLARARAALQRALLRIRVAERHRREGPRSRG